VRSHERKIETVFGTLSSNRAGYGNEDVASLHPLDAELNIPPEVSYSKSMEKGSDRPLTRPNILTAISLGGTNACGEKNYTKLSAHLVVVIQ
jgi:hypothetical protein